MDTMSNSAAISSSSPRFTPRFRCFDPTNSYPETPNHRRPFPTTFNTPTSTNSKSRVNHFNSNSNMENSRDSGPKIVAGEAGYVLEDVPHLSDYIPHLPVILSLSLLILSLLIA